MVGCINVVKNVVEAGTSGRVMTLAAVFCWRPVKNLKVLPFVLDNKNYNIESIPTALLAGAALPLQVDRTLFYGQK